MTADPVKHTLHRVCPCVEQPAWRSSPCDCCSGLFERVGLLFPDRKMEASFLLANKRSKLAVAVLPITFVVSLIAGALAIEVGAQGTNWPGGKAVLILTLVLPSCVGLLLSMVPCCLRARSCIYPLQGIATWTCAFVICLTGGIIIGIFASDEKEELSFVNVSNFPTVSGLTTSDVRKCGMLLNSGTVNAITIMWVLQKIIIVANVVSARVMFAVAGFNVLVLLVACGLVFVRPSFVDEGYAQCARSTVPGLVSMVCSLLIDTIAAAFALVWTLSRRAAGMRQLHFWTIKLELDVKQLHGEANPFDPDNLRRWLQAAGKASNTVALAAVTAAASGQANTGFTAQSGVDSSTGSPRASEVSSVSNNGGEFWAIPASDVRLQSKIAAGASGAVWRATYRGRAIAAKQLFSNAAEAMDVTELAHEVAVLGQLAHKHIVKFLGLCTQHDAVLGAQVYIIQEFCPSNLRSWMEEVAPTLGLAWRFEEVKRIAKEIVDGGAFLHSRQIVHRDLKPENILLAGDASVRIGDFGVSSQSRAVAARRLATEDSLVAAAGTLEYMAPETYVLGLNEATLGAEPPVDVYSFGIILWELLAIDKSSADTHKLQGLWQCHRETYHETQDCRLSVDDIKGKWEWPSLGFCHRQHSHFPANIVDAVESSWKFVAVERASFAQLSTRLDAAEASRPLGNVGRSTKVRTSSWDWDASTGMGLLHEPLVREDLEKPAFVPLQDGTGIDDTMDGYDERDRANSRDKAPVTRAVSPCTRCWVDFWVRRGMHFGLANHAEERFQAYVHSDEFYAVVKWPFEILGGFHALAAISLAVVGGQWASGWAAGASALNVADAILYCTAGALGWWTRGRSKANEIVGWLVAVKLLVMAVSMVLIPLSPDLTFNDTDMPLFLNDAEVFSGSWEECGLLVESNGSALTLLAPSNECWDAVAVDQATDVECNGQVLVANDERTALSWEHVLENNFLFGQFLFDLKFGIVFFHLLTMPISLIMLALPFRMYMIALLVAVVVTFFVAFARIVDMIELSCFGEIFGGVTIFKLATLLFAAVIVFTSGAISVVQNEKTRRSLFVLYSSLHSQETALTKDANFRKYRDVMLTNRSQFSLENSRVQEMSHFGLANESVGDRAHLVKAVTIS
eukprot:INCI5025.6.p1 GENE.INCI5025.6~~INCI5025.6.p1  ORF type:complete len:1135 (+),score=208.66 INCI5025.6:423-3827(+)